MDRRIDMHLRIGNSWKTRTLVALLAAVAVTVVAQSAWAKTTLTDEQKAEAKARLQAYKEKLNLSDEQAVKVEEINRVYFEGLAKVKQSNDRKMAKAKKAKELQSEKDKKMKEVLTEEQFKVYKEFQAEMAKEMKERRMNAAGAQ
jgi:hypothetical protein